MPRTLPQLARDLYDARRAEDGAKVVRIQTEGEIAALVPTDDTGSKTVDAGEGLKVCVKRAMGYDADVEAIRALGLTLQPELMPLALHPPVAAEYGFDEKAYELLRTKHPDIFAKVAKFVTATPRKVSVTLKLA
jgi:hypothetical protein